MSQSPIKYELTLNAVEVNFKARAQLWILHPFKLLEEPVDCILEGFIPLDLCFYRRGENRFTVAGHPHAQISRELKQRDASAHLNSWLLVPHEELELETKRRKK